MQDSAVSIYNAVEPYHQELLGSGAITLSHNNWHTIAFSVNGLGEATSLKLWVDDTLCFDVFNDSGYQHDDEGYIALGSSNHLNRQIQYDDASGSADEAPISEPASIFSFGAGLAGLGGIKTVSRKNRA